MDIHFSRREYGARKRAVSRDMDARGLDGLLMFRQESMYYLTGMQTFGYCFFQCVYLGASGRTVLLTRLPDILAAEFTTIVDERREWRNVPGANPALDLRKVLEENGCEGKRLGIELDAYGLTAYNYRRVDAALNNFCVDKLRPGNTFSDVFEAYAKAARKHGMKHLQATGYGLGTTFPPTWMDWPMFWGGNDQPIEPGMVLFIHTLVISKDEKVAMHRGKPIS